LPEDLVPGWRRLTLSAVRLLARYFWLSFAAWIGSIPLSAKYFHLFSPVSAPANVIAVPLGTLALMSNLGALICGTWLPWATELFNHAAWFFMTAMTEVSEWATRIPGSYFYVREPSWFSVILYYAVLMAALSGWWNTRRRKVFGLAVLVVIAGVYFYRWERSRAEIELTVLPLGGGHAVYVDAAGRRDDWLVNSGNENAAQFTLKSFLRAHGVNRIQRLALTEGDVKDCGGTKALNEAFGIDELWTSGARFRSAIYHDAVATFEAKPGAHQFFNADDTNGFWRMLWPVETNRLGRADDNALVLRGDLGGARVLLLSDLSRSAQSGLLEAGADVRADIVVAGLPDEGEPLSDALLEAIGPKVVVIADAEFPATRRANQKLKDRLAQKNVPVIYTREAGAVKIVADGAGWRLQTMAGQTFDGRR